MNPLVEDLEFLEHFGIKGMRWGVRKDTMPNFLPSSGNQAVKDGKIFVKSVMRQLGEKKMSDLRNIHYSHGYQILNVIQNVLDATS